MSNQNNTLDKILDYELRPWLPQNSLDDVFASKFRSLKEYISQQPLKFEIEFFRPFDNKTKYYSRLILNTVKSDFDTLYQTIDEDRNEKLVLYYLDVTLNKRLKTRLKDLGEVLKEKDYSLAYINPKNTSHQLDQTHKANTYIMQLLKLGYMQLYLEIQEAFKEYRDDLFIVEDFYTQLLNEPIPDQLPIKKIQIIEVSTKPAKQSDSLKTSKTTQFNSFTYKHLDINPDAIRLFYESLKNQEFISEEDKSITYKNFKKFFDGSKIEELTPIIWRKDASSFAHLIWLLHNNQKLILDLKQKQWKIAFKLFLDSDGNVFPYLTKKSIKSATYSAMLLKAINCLKI